MGTIKKLLRWAFHVEGVYGLIAQFWPAAIPTACAAIAAAFGILAESPIPIPYIIASSAVVFAAIATGLVRVDEWRTRTNPSGKLQPEVKLLYGVDVDKNGSRKEIKAVQFGFSVRSVAQFPLFFTVETISSEFMGRVNPGKQFESKEIEVPATGEGYWRDASIPLNVEILTNQVERGKFSYRVAYWKDPKKKFYLEKSYAIEAHFKPDGSISFANHEK